MSLKGEVLDTYTHTNWSGIAGVTCVEDGQVLVCNGIRNTVDVVGSDGKDIVTLLNSTRGIDQPRSICYSPSQATLIRQQYYSRNANIGV